MLGLYALSRMSLVLDGARFEAYILPSQMPPGAYPHNRLGAVFIPRQATGDDLNAVVAKGSPTASSPMGRMFLRKST